MCYGDAETESMESFGSIWIDEPHPYPRHKATDCSLLWRKPFFKYLPLGQRGPSERNIKKDSDLAVRRPGF